MLQTEFKRWAAQNPWKSGPKKAGRRDRLIPREQGRGHTVGPGESQCLEVDRAFHGVDDYRVERELLEVVGFLQNLGTPVDFWCATVHAEGGTETVEEGGVGGSPP